MDQQALISAVAGEVRARLENESSGHDWWHIHRVWRMAQRIARDHDANILVVQLAALLHDIADWKLHGGDETAGPRAARSILERHDVPEEIIRAVSTIICEISFKGAGVTGEPSTLEGKIVQDADRLDAIGAIGIARAFAYGGHAGRTMHDPEAAPVMHTTKEAYLFEPRHNDQPFPRKAAPPDSAHEYRRSQGNRTAPTPVHAGLSRQVRRGVGWLCLSGR